MANTHLETAHAYGVQKALEKCGYTSLAEVEKEATDLGLVGQPAAPAKTASALDGVFAAINNKIG